MKTRKVKKLTDGETYSYYANPFYDEVLIFLDRVPSAQEKYKPIKNSKRFYERYEKDNVKAFKQSIKERLSGKLKPWWPIGEHLFAVVVISGPKNEIETIDIDNLLKTIFDSLSGVVFKDDSQIISVFAEKELMPEMSGLAIGLKKIRQFEHTDIVPSLFSGGTHHWAEEEIEKLKRGGITNFDSY